MENRASDIENLAHNVVVVPPVYNTIFERFVDANAEAGSDLVGAVAYSLYKTAKREWATEFRSTTGRPPGDAELRAYHSSWTPQLIYNARSSAEQALAAYADKVISAEEPRILRNALKGNNWTSIWTSIVANVAYTLILIALAIVLAKSGIDLIGIVKDTAQPAAETQSTKTLDKIPAEDKQNKQ